MIYRSYSDSIFASILTTILDNEDMKFHAISWLFITLVSPVFNTGGLHIGLKLLLTFQRSGEGKKYTSDGILEQRPW